MKHNKRKLTANPASDAAGGYTRWFHELKTLAKKKDLEWLLGPDPDEMRDWYEDGLSPKESLEELIMEARASV